MSADPSSQDQIFTPWLKVKLGAVYAGDLSPRTLYAAIARGELKAARIGAGRNFVVRRDWIDRWLEEHAKGGVLPEKPK